MPSDEYADVVDQLLKECENTIEQSIDDLSFLEDDEKEVVKEMVRDGRVDEAEAVVTIAARNRTPDTLLGVIREAIPYV